MVLPRRARANPRLTIDTGCYGWPNDPSARSLEPRCRRSSGAGRSCPQSPSSATHSSSPRRMTPAADEPIADTATPSRQPQGRRGFRIKGRTSKMTTFREPATQDATTASSADLAGRRPDIGAWANFQGEVVPIADATVSIATHALNYGTAVFEGIRATHMTGVRLSCSARSTISGSFATAGSCAHACQRARSVSSKSLSSFCDATVILVTPTCDPALQSPRDRSDCSSRTWTRPGQHLHDAAR